MKQGPVWSSMTERDLRGIVSVSKIIHPNMSERPEVFAEKLKLFPSGCFILGRGGNLTGYAISHPWMLYDAPPLDNFLNDLPKSPDCLYLHDIAILPHMRGRGAANTLVGHLATIARRNRLAFIALTSIYGSGSLWRRFGFDEIQVAGKSPTLGSYGPGASYMVKAL